MSKLTFTGWQSVDEAFVRSEKLKRERDRINAEIDKELSKKVPTAKTSNHSNAPRFFKISK